MTPESPDCRNDRLTNHIFASPIRNRAIYAIQKRLLLEIIPANPIYPLNRHQISIFSSNQRYKRRRPATEIF